MAGIRPAPSARGTSRWQTTADSVPATEYRAWRSRPPGNRSMRRLTVSLAAPDAIVRVAQMHQRTNQFNLTSRRLTEADLALESPYAGTMAGLVGRNVTLRYLLLRIAAHTFFHIGDIASVRSRRLGQSVGDYPGLLPACL